MKKCPFLYFSLFYVFMYGQPEVYTYRKNSERGNLPEVWVGREVHEAVADIVGRRRRAAAGSVRSAPLAAGPGITPRISTA